jgi:hypothetical protein
MSQICTVIREKEDHLGAKEDHLVAEEIPDYC